MNGTEAFFAGWCGGTIAATRNLITDREIPEVVRSCSPQEVTNEQLYRVAVRFMENHPEFLHLDLQVLTIYAMRDAWPCAQQPSR
jgi:hypothetical protein